MLKNIINKKQGITLIALVVTIIVLLILAGVSISMLTGKNGVLNRAADAKKNTEDSSDLEYLQTKAYEAITDYYSTGSTDSESEYILKNFNDPNIVADVNTGTVKYNGKTYDISEIIGKTNEQKAIESQTDVKLKQITKSNATGRDVTLFETGKVRMIIQEANDETLRAVIPNGFYYVTGAPSTGLVVSDKFGDDDDNSKGGNQFVWVPCEGTNNVSYEKTDDGSVEKKFGLASSWSKNYSSHSSYYSEYKDWTDYGGDLESVQRYGGFYVARYEAGVPNEAPFYADIDGAKYTTDEKNTTEYKPVSKKNNQAWNYVYQKTAKTLSEKMYEESEIVKSQLIDSYAWDTIVDWMEKAVPGIGNDSTGYGNYRNSGLKVQNSLYAIFQYKEDFVVPTIYNKGNANESEYMELATGATTTGETKVKNIYDMAGNMWEWTTEVGNQSKIQSMLTNDEAEIATYAVLRGGTFTDYGKDWTISQRYGGVTTDHFYYFHVGFRVVLYIK